MTARMKERSCFFLRMAMLSALSMAGTPGATGLTPRSSKGSTARGVLAAGGPLGKVAQLERWGGEVGVGEQAGFGRGRGAAGGREDRHVFLGSDGDRLGKRFPQEELIEAVAMSVVAQAEQAGL